MSYSNYWKLRGLIISRKELFFPTKYGIKILGTNYRLVTINSKFMVGNASSTSFYKIWEIMSNLPTNVQDFFIQNINLIE